MYSYGPPHMAEQKQDDQLKHTYSSYVMIRDVTLKTCQRRWMIGRRGERGSGISMLAARHDDDDDDLYALTYMGPVGRGKRIHRLDIWRGVRLPYVCPGYITKQSDSEAPVMLELWGMRSTPLLPSPSGSLCPREVEPDRVLSMGQI